MANTSRFEQIAEELSTVQDALDRALVLLAEARAEKPA
jgi:exonuclease VII small subunit